MSLFPAYAQDLVENNAGGVACVSESSSVSPGREAQLLASDNDDEREPARAAPTSAQRDSAALDSSDYYLDRKFDCGNLRVSTLYYPGRPQYETQKRVLSDGAAGGGRAARRRRYFEARAGAGAPAPAAADELAERTRAFRQMLADQPADEALWLRFIDFQERYRDAEAALVAAGEAAARLPRVPRLRAELHRLRARALQPLACRDLLRAELTASAPARSPAETTELWLRLLGELALRGDGAELDECVRLALSATRAHAPAYPHILYVYGGYLRSAGLWERLVLLLELVTSMNFGADAFPPPTDRARLDQIERDLQDAEDKVVGSGLPLSTVWARVERARAAAHWRPAAGADAGADPQRSPLAADVAELLLPAQAPEAQLLLLLHALRLAKVPLLPCGGYVLRAADAANCAAGDEWWAAGGEALLALVRAARRLPPAHGASAAPATARRLLAQFVDPPHYFSDDAGYLSWVRALWDASLAWSAGSARAALLCWRLRWLQALLLAGGAGEEEARRVRAEARAALKRWAGADPLPYAQFARLERAAGAGDERARRAALSALRAALREPGAAPHRRLYVARVVSELCPAGRDWAAAWGTACAALGAELPVDECLARPPPDRMLEEALCRCETECARLEAALDGEGSGAEEAEGAGLLAALLPAPAEWAAARVRLAAPPRRAALWRDVLRAAAARGPAAARYWEHSACALVVAAAREHRMVASARALAPLFPHNALLALACGDGPLWSCAAGWAPEPGRSPAAGPRSHVGALALVLPPLLRAVDGDWTPQEAARVVAACGRAARAGAGGALLAAVRLEAEARAPRPRPAPALLAALVEHPHCKWLYVRGAAWCGAEAAALADVLLERQLRTHALRDELAECAAAAPAPPGDA